MEDLTMLRAFEIVTRDEATAEQFMAAVRAEDVSIEDWSGVWPGPEYESYVCSFGLTPHSKRQLDRTADALGVSLIYVKTEL
jgi:hypothetical protein